MLFRSVSQSRYNGADIPSDYLEEITDTLLNEGIFDDVNKVFNIDKEIKTGNSIRPLQDAWEAFYTEDPNVYKVIVYDKQDRISAFGTVDTYNQTLNMSDSWIGDYQAEALLNDEAAKIAYLNLGNIDGIGGFSDRGRDWNFILDNYVQIATRNLERDPILQKEYLSRLETYRIANLSEQEYINRVFAQNEEFF